MAAAKDAIGTTAKMFWLYQASALAAALLAFLPDRSATYTQAIAELRRVLLIHVEGRPDLTRQAMACPPSRLPNCRR